MFRCRDKHGVIPLPHSFSSPFWRSSSGETRPFSIPLTISGEVSANVTIKRRRERHGTPNKLLIRHPYGTASLNQPPVSPQPLAAPFVFIPSPYLFAKLSDSFLYLALLDNLPDVNEGSSTFAWVSSGNCFRFHVRSLLLSPVVFLIWILAQRNRTIVVLRTIRGTCERALLTIPSLKFDCDNAYLSI